VQLSLQYGSLPLPRSRHDPNALDWGIKFTN
jgi:hypothetical protein